MSDIRNHIIGDVMKPLKRKSRQEYVMEQIQDLIIQNALKPNDYLPSEIEMAQALNVSRSTVREALRRLETMGIVDISHGERPRVSTLNLERFLDALRMFMVIDKDEFIDLMELRKILEIGAVDIVIDKLTPEHAENLKRYIEIMKENIDDPEVFALNDFNFHLELIKATENFLLHKLMDIVGVALLKVQRITSRFPSSKTAIPHHEAILDALLKRDKNKAKKILTEHIDTSKQKLIEYFNLREKNRSTTITSVE